MQDLVHSLSPISRNGIVNEAAMDGKHIGTSFNQKDESAGSRERMWQRRITLEFLTIW